MDKKNTSIGVLLLLAAFALMFYSGNQRRQTPPTPPSASSTTQSPANSATPASEDPAGPRMQAGPDTPAPVSGVPLQFGSAPTPHVLFAPREPAHADEQITTVRNDRVQVRFTNYGGAIAEVVLRDYRAHKTGNDPFVLNTRRHAPMLAFARVAGADFYTPYELVSASDHQVVYRTVVAGQLEITRTYTISADPAQQDPYVIRNETTLRNLTNAPLTASRLALNLGTASLENETENPTYLNAVRYDGEDARITPYTELSDEGFFSGLGLSTPAPRALAENIGPTAWGAVETQFFATIVTTRKPGSGIVVRRVELAPETAHRKLRYGLTTDMYLDLATIPPGGSETLGFDVYAGPKEFDRLERLGQNQDAVMQWGWFDFIAKILLTLMKAVHSLFAGADWAWGWAIVSTTVIIRVLMWPLTGMSTRAAKRMAKIQGPLKELQEKYKDNRQKLTEETMKLWKEHKVNPAAGCLPIFVQMPIFFGLFSMLRSAAELRFAEFLWANDLSAPDTVAYIPLLGFPLNPMPILMGITSLVQMRMTPTPTTDNPSAKMMKFMPIMFVVLCYNFSSGLAVYWTASNLFSIFQQWVTNRQRDPITLQPAKPGAAERAKPVRDAKVTNVDRKKKR